MDLEIIGLCLILYFTLAVIFFVLLILQQSEINELRNDFRNHWHPVILLPPDATEAPPVDAPPLADMASGDDQDWWKHGRPNPLDSEFAPDNNGE